MKFFHLKKNNSITLNLDNELMQKCEKPGKNLKVKSNNLFEYNVLQKYLTRASLKNKPNLTQSNCIVSITISY